MGRRTLGVVMNGVTGRMGYRQHLVRSILAIRDSGGLLLPDGTRVMVEPLLVGRDATRVAEVARRHDLDAWTTDLDAALGDDDYTVYFDATATQARPVAVTAALAAGRHVYTEKPLGTTTEIALDLARKARDAGVVNGVVHDKLFLPGIAKLRRLVAGGFFGRTLSLRGEFGYWVFEGDWQGGQRPSWNYRAEDGGGITLDMFCHWNYLLEDLVGLVEAVTARATTHVARRWDERGEPYQATADDASYAIFELAGGVMAQINSSWCVRVHRDELLELQLDGTEGSAVAGLHGCVCQHRANTPMPVWDPDRPETQQYREQWLPVPDNTPGQNAFRAQWEQFLGDVLAGRHHRYDFLAGARGVRLAEAGVESSAKGYRVELPELTW
jgi:predicted dehydrogenase